VTLDEQVQRSASVPRSGDSTAVGVAAEVIENYNRMRCTSGLWSSRAGS
jgi:hypothetical protein